MEISALDALDAVLGQCTLAMDHMTYAYCLLACLLLLLLPAPPSAKWAELAMGYTQQGCFLVPGWLVSYNITHVNPQLQARMSLLHQHRSRQAHSTRWYHRAHPKSKTNID